MFCEPYRTTSLQKLIPSDLPQSALTSKRGFQVLKQNLVLFWGRVTLDVIIFCCTGLRLFVYRYSVIQNCRQVLESLVREVGPPEWGTETLRNLSL